MINKEVHSECRSFPTRENKLHWSKPFLVLHPLKSSLIKKKTQDKPKYSSQRKIESTSGAKQSAFTSGRAVPAQRSQIKCEATSGLNIARKQKKIIIIIKIKNKKKQHYTFTSPKPDMIGNSNIEQSYLVSQLSQTPALHLTRDEIQLDAPIMPCSRPCHAEAPEDPSTHNANDQCTCQIRNPCISYSRKSTKRLR